MTTLGIVVTLTREEDNRPPLLLKPLLFSPVALWLSRNLLSLHPDAQFFVLGGEADLESAKPCFPEGTQFALLDSPDTSARLLAFQKRDSTLAVSSPVTLTGPSTTLVLERDDSASWRGYQATAQQMEIERLEAMGARFIDPSSCFCDPTVTVGEGTVLLPGTILKGNTTIGKGCTLGPNTMITHCIVGDGVTVNSSQLNESTVEDGCNIGPFAYIRPDCHIGANAKIGDFVELKNATIGAETKIPHLAYVGDADVGSGSNLGCGTVTANYDGIHKHRTTVGNGAFIGCSTNLVAPVSIGDGAFTAAGSIITQDVPAHALAVARARQIVKEDWASKRPKKN